jgi:multidrug resistance efflux pump
MDEAMSGITQAQAQAQLDALLEAQSNNFLSVSIAGRTVTYRTAEDVIKAINYWQRVVSGFQRSADGHSRHGFQIANFQSRQ